MHSGSMGAGLEGRGPPLVRGWRRHRGRWCATSEMVRAWPCQPCPDCCWGSPNWIDATPVFVAKNHGEARPEPMGAPPLLPPN
eukprot:COSAG01_NODE_169_length_23159_cov_44.920035_4_plen_83_part_00